MNSLFKVVNNEYVYKDEQPNMVELRTDFYRTEGWFASDEEVLRHYGYKD